ncbi:MAG: hypothetical protein PHP54_00470 [Clostridia bacterium]|nr:hypothetical protein [Clostridia bacterium]
MKKFSRKKILSFLLVIAMCFTLAVPSYATELPVASDALATQELMVPNTRAISGMGSVYFNGAASFTINSPGWSLYGEAVIYNAESSTAVAYVQIISPNGKNCFPDTVIQVAPGRQVVQRINNSVAGTYTVYVSSPGAGAVSVLLRDA